MTDDDKALVERLRDFVIAEDIDLAADRIEALSAENERLRDQLEYAVGELSKYRAKYMVGTSAPLGETK